MKTIFTENGALFLLGYLLIFMIMGTFAISKLNSLKEFNNLQIRKMFHVLAFLLFLPGVFINVRRFPFISFSCLLWYLLSIVSLWACSMLNWPDIS
jgi:formate hydrogenlyase subunit 4